ncbi:MAG: hypothetical protein QGG54_17685, partial [Gammaproteobacteria bacterium]|nr:hypothetical protein [Gammaproteobacteria bacterium]
DIDSSIDADISTFSAVCSSTAEITVADGNDLTLGNAAKDAYFMVAAHSSAGSEDVRIVNTNGTDAKAIEILATAGGVSIECADEKEAYIGNNAKDAYVTVAASGTPGNEDIRIVNTNGTDAKAIEILATAGGVSIECADEKEVYIGNNAKDAYVTVAAHGTAGSEDIRIVNTNGTDAKAIEILATAGGVSIECADGKEAYIGNNAKDAYVTVAAHGTAGSEDIRIVNTNGTDAAAVEVKAAAGGILLDVDTADKKIHLDSEGSVDIDAVTGLSIDCTGPANLTVTADATGEDLTIAQAGVVDASVHISSAGTAADALTIKTSAGGMDIEVAGADPGEDLDITANSSIKITASEAVDDAIVLNASAGGVDIDAAAAKPVTIDGGQLIATAVQNTTDAIKLHADAGTSQRIVLLNDEGTTDGAAGGGTPVGALALNTAAGGIGIGWADDKDLWAEGGRAIINANENAQEAIRLHAGGGV